MDARLEIFQRLLRPLRPGRLLDLGTGHGKFAIVARDLGWDVTAVDARRDRMPMASGIDWVVRDVREQPTEGFDLIANLGLLYHLDLESQQTLLRRCAPTPMILDTHTAERAEERVGDLEGCLYREPGLLTSSWGNPESFWPTGESLGVMLREAGYREVYHLEPAYTPGRTFYWCI